MKIQTKVIIGILPMILISIMVLGFWAFETASKGIEESFMQHMNTKLDVYMTNKVIEFYNILTKNHLENEDAFVKEYQKKAAQSAKEFKLIESGHIFIMTGKGKFLFCTNNNNEGLMEALWGKLAAGIAREDGSSINSGHMYETVKESIYVTRYFKPWNWVIFYAVSDDEVHKAQDSIRNATLMISGFCITATIILVFLIFRKFFVIPLKKIHDAASAISKGETISAIDVRSGDELGNLSRNMELMAQSIEKHRAEQKMWQEVLEEKVRIQTEHLHKEIEERKRAEAERMALEVKLMQKQKLESVGTLAGGVAHEINNPVNGIMNYAQLLVDGLEPDNSLRDFAKEIISETERVASIVYSLLTFSQQDKNNFNLARTTDIVNSALKLTQTEIKKDHISIIADVPEDLPQIKCRNRQIQQVLMNMLSNARNTLNDKYPGYDPDKIISITAIVQDKKAKKWIQITVEDHGQGIPENIRTRLFDPFFTTQCRSKNSGMGLYISYAIIEEHGGELTVESEPGKYTRFHIDLPAASQCEDISLEP